MRYQHEIPRFFRVHRGQFLPHALGESRVATYENRDVGAQRQPQPGQAIFIPAQLPQMIQAQQCCCGIRAAATDAAAHGQDLVDPDIDAQRASGLLLQFSGGLDDQVAVVGNTFELSVQMNDTVIAQGVGDFVAVIEKLKHRLQFVVAVFAATQNVQHQIEFGWRGQRQAIGRHVTTPVCAVARS
ncbi:hypothetical protein D3C72_811110 [compost metagenome]